MENDFKIFAVNRIEKYFEKNENSFIKENEKVEELYNCFRKSLSKEQSEELEKIVNLYNSIRNEENILSYKIGFQDGIKIIN